MPTVLLVHIPIYLPQLGRGGVCSCGDPRWGWNSDRIYKIERRQRWPRTGNLKSTAAFVELVKKTENLVAVLAGHTHRARALELFPTAFEYIAPTAFSSESRIVRFRKG
jgi:hypothetical protein